MTPRVSVVLPTRNRKPTLGRAVRSVLAQTMSDLELLIVDDGSSDGSAEWLAELRDSRVRVLKATRGGAAAARNIGVSEARGPFVAFQDSDDEWSAQKLERQLATFEEEPAAGLVYCAVLHWDGTRVQYLPSESDHPLRNGDVTHIVRWRNIAQPSWLVRRECFDRVGLFDEALPAVEDWEWMMRFCSHYRARLVDEPLLMVYVTDDSLSMCHDRVARALVCIEHKHGSWLRRDSLRALSRLRLVAGVRACMAADFKEGRAAFSRGCSERPWDLSFPAAWLLSFAGPGAMQAAWTLARRIRG